MCWAERTTVVPSTSPPLRCSSKKFLDTAVDTTIFCGPRTGAAVVVDDENTVFSTTH